MKVIVKALYTEPVLFLSAVAGVFTVGGAVAVALGVPPALGVACGIVGPAIAGAARKWAYSPKTVEQLTAAKGTPA
jgi:ABC-type uncharacterized transport system permease subunit